MEPGTRFAAHVDRFKELVLQMETIGEALDETRQLVLLLGSLTAEYRMISTVLENTPNMTLAYAIQALSGVEVSNESSSTQEKAFASKKKEFGKRRFIGNCFNCKKPGHKESECRKKKADEGRGQVARETSDFAFTATGAMEKSKWLVDSGASSHMTSARDKFVSMKALKMPVRITIADGTKIDAVATGTVGLKLMDGTTVTLSDCFGVGAHGRDWSHADQYTWWMHLCGDIHRRLLTTRDRLLHAGEIGGAVKVQDFQGSNGERNRQGDKNVCVRIMAVSIPTRRSRPTWTEVASSMRRRCRIDKKWWAEAVNTAARIINRIPNSVNVKTPYEIVHRTKPQLKNMKVFGSLSYAHIPDEKRRKLDPKAFKCKIMGYEDGVKGYRALNVATGKVQIVRTVKFMETADPDQLMNRLEMDEDEEAGDSEADDEQFAIEGGKLMAATEEVPRSYDEATASNNRAQWKAAIECELSSLMTNKPWRLVPKPKHQRAIGCRWVFALKRDETGRIVRHKARLVAKGYSHRHVRRRYCIHVWGMEEEIYMELPDGLMEILDDTDDGDEDLVCLLEKCLYGLKQASRVWNETIDRHLKSMGFKPTKADPCVYTRDDNDQRCVVCLYVDDMLIASRDQDEIISVKAQIAEKFKIKELGQARYILGIEIDYNMEVKTLGICQRAYTEAVIKKFGQEHANPSLIPLDTSVHLTKNGEPKTDEEKAKMRPKPYRSLIGSLMYLACGTRSDISVAVAKLSRLLENPGEKHWNAGIKVVKYLLKTKNIGILYDGALSSKLVAYSDADWAGNRDDRRSVSGVMVMMCGAPVVWRSTFQKTVALSSTEAGYMALSECVKEVVWMRLLLKDLGSEQTGGTVVYEDNQGAMALAKNGGYQ
ncbi:unnamed protein product [Phytophthora fragariaefolia]|uniref:Unnamed protein product n=1 Tax=Phytophthora fragariaefolia TaxID=1490495 RepID=A0A9W7CR29_9STRA|nr:unnamed protein product [Phytophthora fragariaefolia]